MAKIRFNGGLCTSKDRAELPDGQLQTATGITYKPGDSLRAHKIGGRTSFGTAAAGLVKSVALAQFDTGGTDKLLAYAGTTISGATPGVTGTFGSLITGLDASATKMSVVHAYDKFIIANGYDRNNVLKSNGTVRKHGMLPPVGQCDAVAAAVATVAAAKPTAQTNGTFPWINPANAYDAVSSPKNLGTFSYAQTAVAGRTITETWHTWASLAAATRMLSVWWSLDSITGRASGTIGTGGSYDMGSNVTVLIEYSLDGGSNFLTLASFVATTQALSARRSGVQFSVNNNLVQVRASLTLNSGVTVPVMRIYDIKIQTATQANFSTTTGLFYAFTEWDGTNLLESAASPASDLVTMTSQNQVTVTLPGTAGQQNTTTTHYRVYRTFDGGVSPKDLGLIAEVPVSSTSFIDYFEIYEKDDVPAILYPLVSITEGGGTIYIDRDSPPAAFAHVGFFKGSVVGVSRTQPRILAYSFAGRPDSWPSLYIIDTLPLLEHDSIVATASAGDTLIIGCQNNMLAIDDLPRTVQGVFSTVDARPLRGQPGLVSQDAIASFSVAGEPRVAWMSRYGLHWTNGTQAARISLSIDWNGTTGLGTSTASTAVLWWDPRIQCLVLAYDSDGDSLNDRWFLIHMAPEHQNEDGQQRWTGPHYGKLNCITGGTVSGVYRRYSGHVSDTNVYLEDNGTTDASQAFSGTQVPLIVKTGRLYGAEREWGAFKANLRHTAFGGSEIVSVLWTTGRDQRSTTQSVTKTPSVVLQQGNEFYVGLQGEWHEIQITHTGSASGALLDLGMTPILAEKPGRVA